MEKNVKKFQKWKNKLLFEDGSQIVVTKEMMQRFSLQGKEALSEEEYEELFRYRLRFSAYTWLSKRDYSSWELEVKLSRYCSQKQWISDLLKDLQQKGYLDDYRYAIQWVQSKKYGRAKMEYFLLQKGYSREFVRKVLDEAYQTDTKEIIKIWNTLAKKEKEKRVMALLRKGYHYSEIKKALAEIEE